MLYFGTSLEAKLARRLQNVEANSGFNPLTLLVDQRHQRHGGAANKSGQLRQFVEGWFRTGIEDIVAM